MSIKIKLSLLFFFVVMFILTLQSGILFVLLEGRTQKDFSGVGSAFLEKILLEHGAVLLVFAGGMFICSYVFAGWAARCFEETAGRIRSILEKEIGENKVNGDISDFQRLTGYLDVISRIIDHKNRQLQRASKELSSAHVYLEALTDAIHVMDLNGRLLQINKAFERLYGWTASEVIGKPPRIIPQDRIAESARLVRKVRDGGQVNGYDTVHLTKDGKEIHVSLTLSPVYGDDGNLIAFASITRDITERKQTEEMLRRSEKLSVVGQLAAGVAHEIRNPLTTLRGFVQLQQMKGEGNPHYLELMLAELDRINLIVGEFLILSKPQLSRFQYKDIRIVVKDIIQLLEPQSHLNNIVIETSFDPELPVIKCEENQLKQVFINLLKNSMEAMPAGGSIEIEVRQIDQSRIMVRVTDHGGGIPEDYLSRLGEPFFTSKENGTGLGIMVSQQIIANHMGNMLIRSELGKGTCVDIILPVDF